MYLTSTLASAAQLTSEKKKQIRRNEQIRQEQYASPQIFKLVKLGSTKFLDQGDTVLGKVKVVTSTEIACQLIYVELKGVVNVDFNVPSTTMIDEIQNFKNEWEFFNHKIPVLMHEQRGYNFLEPGIYEFYFKARIPIGGPCSFLTDIASVTYKFSGVFVRNDVTVDVLSQNQLTYHVRGYKDLNPYDGARVGYQQQKITHVGGFLGLFRGRVEIKVETDRRAFVPGDKIHIVGEVLNTTWRKCELRYELLQIIKMWGEHYFWRGDVWGRRYLKDELVMDRGVSRPILSGNKITLKETLIIPKGIEPSYLGMTAKDYINDLINLEYKLRFEVDIPYSPNVRVVVPIIIGTEPFIELKKAPVPFSPKGSIELPRFDRRTSLKPDQVDPSLESPIQIPRFHPLNPFFQQRFPERFGGGPKSEDHPKMRKERGKHKSKCRCKKKRHKKLCRVNCDRKPGFSDSSSDNFGPRRINAAVVGTGLRKRVTTDYGHGMPLEECTYVNWLEATVENYQDGRGGVAIAKNMLLNVMRQYGLISGYNINANN